MASLSLIRAHFHALAQSAQPAASAAHLPFPDSLWATEARIREGVDALVHPTRWRVRWLANDGTCRTFYLKGTHESVRARAHSFFTSGTILVEPAPFPYGPERFDARLSLSTTTGEI